MKTRTLWNSVVSVVLLSIISMGVILFVVHQQKWIGLIFIGIGLLHLLVLKFFAVRISSL